MSLWDNSIWEDWRDAWWALRAPSITKRSGSRPLSSNIALRSDGGKNTVTAVRQKAHSNWQGLLEYKKAEVCENSSSLSNSKAPLRPPEYFEGHRNNELRWKLKIF